MIANRIRIYEFCIIELYIKVLRKPQASSFRNSINSQNLDKVSGKKDVWDIVNRKYKEIDSTSRKSS